MSAERVQGAKDVEQQQARIEARVNRGLLSRWYIVAKSAELHPGKLLPVKALGTELVLWRGADGVAHCVEDRCPHRGARLSRGQVFQNDLACHYHGVTVNGAGEIVRVPAMGNCGLEGRKAIEGYAVYESQDGIFVYFASAGEATPPPPTLPEELSSPQYATFLATSPWNCNYRYVLDNLVDPMHGIYLHGDTFTLSRGIKEDKVQLEVSESGFIVSRVAQQETNVDWAEIVVDAPFVYSRVLIPYPPAGGPGGPMMVIACVTPVDEHNCRIFFWRTRKVSGVAREAWRFMFRAMLEERHWYVLEQDRQMMASIVEGARDRELLYQNDIGVARLRRILAQKAREQIEREDALAVS